MAASVSSRGPTLLITACVAAKSWLSLTFLGRGLMGLDRFSTLV
jgi:hypothetical protein